MSLPSCSLAMPWYKLLAKRLPWLVVLLLLQSFGALIMNHYDDLLSKHLVLNFFIPMMQGTSGNAGNQVRRAGDAEAGEGTMAEERIGRR